MSQKLGIEEALDIAMDAELKAWAFYAQAAAQVQDPHGRDLLGRLAAFEQYHYQKLSELTRSLQGGGQFIPYETRTMEQFVPLTGSKGIVGGGEAAALPEPAGDVPAILSQAIEKEKIAGERYRVLAEETTDLNGRDMFGKLANEEGIHQRILEDEFFSLSNRGVWGWSGMYGE